MAPHPTWRGCERHVWGVSLRLVVGIAGERASDCSLFPAVSAGCVAHPQFQAAVCCVDTWLSFTAKYSRPRCDHSGCVSVVGSTSALLCEDTYFWAICKPPLPFRDLPVLQFGSKSHTFEGTAAQHSLFSPGHHCTALPPATASTSASSWWRAALPFLPRPSATLKRLQTSAKRWRRATSSAPSSCTVREGAGPLLGQGGAPRSTSDAAQ